MGGCSAANPIPDAVKNVLSQPNPLPDDWQGPAKKLADALPKPDLHDLEAWAKETGKSGSDLVKHLIDTQAPAA
jgi:hypothetical protein